MPKPPLRGPAVRALELPLPPRRMPLLRGGRPLKRWRYAAVYGPELMLCAGDARVAGLPQRWWALALPDGTLLERTSARRVVEVVPGRVIVRSAQVTIELELDERDGVECVSPHGRSYIWTRKQAGIRVSGLVRAHDREWLLDAPLGFVDESAGYHARHTVWRWSAGIGRSPRGEALAWNLVDGVHDAARDSERTVWVDGEPHEVEPVEFARDLSSVGELRFSQWSVREDHTDRLLFRSHYRQPFGSFSGRLPGGLELQRGCGVMEWHDVHW